MTKLDPHGQTTPSPWIAAWLPRVPPSAGRTLLDVACGHGRHLRYGHRLGYATVGIDRDLSGVGDLARTTGFELIAADLEDGSPWPCAGRRFDVVVVANYLHRPLLPAIIAAVADDGVLIYETFGVGNERYGRPSNPDFLLRPGELLEALAGRLTPFAYEHVTGVDPAGNPARVVQRIVAAGSRHIWQGAPPSPRGLGP